MLESPGDLLEELSRAHRLRWTHVEELLALILEQLVDVTYYTAATSAAFTKDGTPPPLPRRRFRYPRPNAPKPKASSFDEIRRFFRR